MLWRANVTRIQIKARQTEIIKVWRAFFYTFERDIAALMGVEGETSTRKPDTMTEGCCIRVGLLLLIHLFSQSSFGNVKHIFLENVDIFSFVGVACSIPRCSSAPAARLAEFFFDLIFLRVGIKNWQFSGVFHNFAEYLCGKIALSQCCRPLDRFGH